MATETVAKQLSAARRAEMFRRLVRLQDVQSRRMADRIQAYFRALSRRMAQRYRTATKQVDSHILYTVQDAALLESLIVAFDLQMAETVATEIAGPLVGADPIDLEALRRFIRDHAAERVTGVSHTIRTEIARTIETGHAAGLSDREVARRLEETIVRASRAETIARTEMALASQEAAHDRYARAGVTEVDISDGPGCGWRSHDDPDKADGTRRTIQEANEYPIAHPRCVRASFPVV